MPNGFLSFSKAQIPLGQDAPMSNNWDPLEAITAQDANILTAARKREMQNILRSYVGFFDPFSELIQNAMDAVDTREKELGRFDKLISIKVDLKENSFSVSDNGIGFRESHFRTFLCPNISFKDGQHTRGKKGVGATYIGYGFNYLQLATKTPDFRYVAELAGGREWLDDINSVIERPKVKESRLLHGSFDEFDRGSSFTVRFGGNSRPRDLTWVHATTADQWKTVLLIKTPLGHITFPGDTDYQAVKFDLEVVDADGNSTTLKQQTAGYIYPHTVISSSIDIDDLVAEQKRLAEKQQDTSKLPDKYKRLNAVYGFWDTTKLLEMEEDAKIQALIQQYKVKAYGFFGYSVKLWDQFNDSIAKLRKGMRILRGGLQLATDHMPQGDLLIIPLTSNIGYQNQAHVIIHFEKADPDLGRKGFQPELRSTAEQLAVAIVNRLKKWRHLLKADSGASPSIVGASNLDVWIKQQEAHETKRPLKITNPNFFAPLNEVSITSLPVSEQDVIVLFNQLVAGGVIRGLRLLATSSHQQYDGIFRYAVTEPLQNHHFDKITNPLGVQDLRHDKAFLSKPFVLEYKYNLDALIQEFENEEKTESHIDLAVTWEIGEQWKKRYSVTSLLEFENLQHREFHGMTHIFRDERTGDVRFYAIILSELLEFLSDPDAAQASQKLRYA
jgi:hypothetical protein